MKNTAVRLHGKDDLRLETFDLPEVGDGDLLVRVISDSVCMSTYKTVLQGAAHLRVPNDVAERPVIIGHEFCAEIVTVGRKWEKDFAVGEKIIMPPVLSYLPDHQTVGYSFGTIGGVSEYGIVDAAMIEHGFVLKLQSDAFFKGSLIEPASCVLRGYRATLHLDEDLLPVAGLKEGGKIAILAGCGPMGLVAIDIALHGERKPSLVVVTDIDKERLARAESLFRDKAGDVALVFSDATDPDTIKGLSGGTGFDDVFVYAPVPALIEVADSILAPDGCLNFFAGPTDKALSAKINFYNVHYQDHHFAGTSGSTPADMKTVVDLIGEGRIDPSVMVTHVGGIDAAIETTKNLPRIPGGKKLIYTHIRMPLTALSDFAETGRKDPRFAELDRITKKHNGLWSAEAEKYLLANFA